MSLIPPQCRSFILSISLFLSLDHRIIQYHALVLSVYVCVCLCVHLYWPWHGGRPSEILATLHCLLQGVEPRYKQTKIWTHRNTHSCFYQFYRLLYFYHLHLLLFSHWLSLSHSVTFSPWCHPQTLWDLVGHCPLSCLQHFDLDSPASSSHFVIDCPCLPFPIQPIHSYLCSYSHCWQCFWGKQDKRTRWIEEKMRLNTVCYQVLIMLNYECFIFSAR